MGIKKIDDTVLKDVAEAIRNKTGTTQPMLPGEMAGRIEEIQVGVDTSDATATENDLPQGLTAYAQGKKITGNVLHIQSGYAAISDSDTKYNTTFQMTDTHFRVAGNHFDFPIFMREGTQFIYGIRRNRLGTAAKEDVVSGKTFISGNGKLKGSLEVRGCYVSAAEPENSVGADGDIYIRVNGETGQFAGAFRKTAGSWALCTDLTELMTANIHYKRREA